MSSKSNMGRVFERARRRAPERTAVVDPETDDRSSYEELADRVARVGAALQDEGVTAGDSVCLVAENRIETLAVYWATQQFGAVFVPLNFRASAGEIAFMLDNVSADVVFFADVASDAVVGALDECSVSPRPVAIDDAPAGTTPYGEFTAVSPSSFDRNWVDAAEPSVILHTSGTTGRPKGAPISHRANYARTMSNPVNLGWERGDVTLGMMPNFHEMGRAAFSSAALLNGTYVAMRDWDPERALASIEAEDISILYLVPTMFHDMVSHDDLADYDVGSVEKVGSSGTPLKTDLYERISEAFEPENVVNFYGCTEMDCMTICSFLDEKPGCAGHPGINTSVRVVEAVEGETVSPDATVPRGDLGEIVVDATSPEAFDGYLDRPAADALSFEGDWYFTGDLGYRDEDGDLWVVGRVDDMVISGGENIHPVEVETVVEAHEAVDACAIGAVDDDRWGDLVTAYVATDADEDYEELAAALDAYCRDSDEVADFKRPRKYVFVDALPRNDTGKKMRRRLRAESVDAVDGIDVLCVVDVD
jgi:2-furoate---CoA ligase